MISREKIQEMVAKIALAVKPNQIILFGSYAWGVPTSSSDVDLCLVFENFDPAQYMDIGLRARMAISGDGIPKDIIIRSSAQLERFRQYKAPLESKILHKGITLYG